MNKGLISIIIFYIDSRCNIRQNLEEHTNIPLILFLIYASMLTALA